MAVRTIAAALPATGVLNLEPANFLFVYTASAAISIQFQGRAAVAGKGGGANLGASGAGDNETLNGIGAGIRVQRLKGWNSCNITGPAGTTITLFYGFETPREDATDFQTTIATITGSVTVVPGLGSANAPTDHADVTIAATTTDTSIAANVARKSVSVGSFSSNAPATSNLRVTSHGAGANKGVELQAGNFYNFQTQSALDVVNPDANAQKYWWQEYT